MGSLHATTREPATVHKEGIAAVLMFFCCGSRLRYWLPTPHSAHLRGTWFTASTPPLGGPVPYITGVA
jgi:hypothetical protein